MAPLLALLSILLGGESEAAAAPAPKPSAAIVEVARHDDAHDSWDFVWAHDVQVSDVQPEEPTVQRWLGKVEIPGQVLDFVVTIVETEDGLTGKLDIPIQGLTDGELRGVHREGDELSFHFEIPSLPEANWPRWVVTIDETGKAAEGVLKQSGATFPSSLVLDETGEAEVLNRPQHPRRPLPYPEIEVAIDAGEHTLAGTLTIPSEDEFGDGPFPAAVLISGSGPQDRDETLLGHKPFFVLSDYLTRRGIAVLRYDDRGFGESTGDFESATSLDFADDARACAEWLNERDDVSHVGLIGHSEGGLVAPLVAKGNEGIDFVVLLAAPGVPGTELLERQLRAIYEADGVGDAQSLSHVVELQQKFFEAMLADDEDATYESLKALIAMQNDLAGVSNEDQAALEQSTRDYMSVSLTPWFKTLLELDPRESLRSVTQPVLVLNGSLDVQVLADQNVPAIMEALKEGGNTRAESRVFEGLNHLFQPTTTGSMSEYGLIETTFDEDVMEQIAQWIIDNVR